MEKLFPFLFFSLLLFGLPCLAAQQQLAAWPSVGSASPPALAQAAGPAPQPAAQQRPATDRWGPLSVASATVSSPTWGRTGAESRAAAASARCSPVRASLGSPAPIKGAPLCAAPPPKTLAPAATPNPSSRRRRRRTEPPPPLISSADAPPLTRASSGAARCGEEPARTLFVLSFPL